MIALNDSGEAVKLRFGEWFRVARGRAGLTQAQIAERLGVKPQTVSNWENGVSSPSLDPVQMFDLCELMGVSLGEMAVAYREGGSND